MTTELFHPPDFHKPPSKTMSFIEDLLHETEIIEQHVNRKLFLIETNPDSVTKNHLWNIHETSQQKKLTFETLRDNNEKNIKWKKETNRIRKETFYKQKLLHVRDEGHDDNITIKNLAEIITQLQSDIEHLKVSTENIFKHKNKSNDHLMHVEKNKFDICNDESNLKIFSPSHFKDEMNQNIKSDNSSKHNIFCDEESCPAFNSSSHSPIHFNHDKHNEHHIDEESGNQQHRKTIINVLRKHEYQFRMSGSEKLYHNGLYNTRTIHMHAVSVAYQYFLSPSPRKKAISWLTAILSLLTIFMQIYITYPLFLDISDNTCAMHADCVQGSFCDNVDVEFWRQPRCNSCSKIEWDVQCSSNLTEQIWGTDFEDFIEKVWFDQDFFSFMNFDFDQDEKKYFEKCSAKQYCEKTTFFGMKNVSCPYLKLHRAKQNLQETICFIFVCFLFASCLSADLKESEVEDKLLDYVLSIAPENATLYSAYLIRITARMRRFYLPLITALAATSVMLSEELTGKNILFNQVAILFLLEADNLLGAIFLTPSHFEVGDELVYEAKKNKSFETSNWSSKFYSFLLSIMMLLSMIHIEKLLLVVSPDNSCTGIDNVLLLLALFLSNVVAVTYALLTFLYDKGNHRIANCLFQYTRMNTALYLFSLLNGVTMFTATSYAFDAYYPIVALCLCITSSICAGIRPYFILKYDIKRSFKNNIIDVAVIICWSASQFWVLNSFIVYNYV